MNGHVSAGVSSGGVSLKHTGRVSEVNKINKKKKISEKILRRPISEAGVGHSRIEIKNYVRPLVVHQVQVNK